MESSIETSCIPSYSKINNLTNEPRSHPRLAQYKIQSIIITQEERRRRLLEEQKAKRSDAFNVNRRLLEELGGRSADMEWSSTKVHKTYAHDKKNNYKNRLMLSEWLENVPEDLAELWYLMPCPKGQRNLVICSGGVTKAYSRHGVLSDIFQSEFPGGSERGARGCTILDCIMSRANLTFYVMDILAWGNQPMFDCETEFRFYWFKSKFEETPYLMENSRDHKYKFLPLAYHPCSKAVMTNVMAVEHLFGEKGPSLDGLLFYHSQTHYTPGKTPLVGWLKPYMMHKVFGIPIAEIYIQQGKKYKVLKRQALNKRMEEMNEVESSREMETSSTHETDEFLTDELEPQENLREG